MTKKQALKIVEDLIEKTKEIRKEFNDASDKFTDSPRAMNCINDISGGINCHIADLSELKSAIDNHEENMKKAETDRLFGMDTVEKVYSAEDISDGLNFTEDEKDGNTKD